MRKAFHDAMNDPSFRADAARMRLEVNEVGGLKVEGILREAYDVPSDVAKIVAEAMHLNALSAE